MRVQSRGVIVGFDVGGTSAKYGLVDEQGEPLTASRKPLCVPSDVKRGPDATLNQLKSAFLSLQNKYDLSKESFSAAGLAVAGPATLDGQLYFSPNFGRSWTGVKIRERLETLLGLRTSYENDANAAGIAELAHLLKRDPSLAHTPGLLVTVGTGLGTAFFAGRGELHRGFRGGGGEFGHAPMPTAKAKSSVNLVQGGITCGCGKPDCAELYISRAFLDREVVARRYEEPTNAVYQGQPATWVDAVPVEAAKGNEFALSILKSQAWNLGLFLGRMDLTLDLCWIVIGGGISGAKETVKRAYLKQVRAGFKEEANTTKTPKAKLLFARLGNNAGWIGAGLSALEMLKQSD